MHGAGRRAAAPRWFNTFSSALAPESTAGVQGCSPGLKWRDTLYPEAARARYRGRMGAARTFGTARKVPFLQGRDEKNEGLKEENKAGGEGGERGQVGVGGGFNSELLKQSGEQK